MHLNRRALLGTFALAVVSPPVVAASEPILRVSGAVTSESYPGLETFLFNSLDGIVGLKVSFDQAETGDAGALNAAAEGVMFVAYLAGPDSRSEIVANEGFHFLHGSYVFDGFYLVKSGGMRQGIVSLSLEQVEESAVLLSGRDVKDIRIDRLDPDVKRQD